MRCVVRRGVHLVGPVDARLLSARVTPNGSAVVEGAITFAIIIRVPACVATGRTRVDRAPGANGGVLVVAVLVGGVARGRWMSAIALLLVLKGRLDGCSPGHRLARRCREGGGGAGRPRFVLDIVGECFVERAPSLLVRVGLVGSQAAVSQRNCAQAKLTERVQVSSAWAG